MFWFSPFNGESKTFSHRHPSSVTTKTTVPKCRCFVATASPRGKPRTQKILAYIIHRGTVLRQFRVAKLTTPTMAVQNHWYTPPNPLPLWKTAENQQSFHEAVDDFLLSAAFPFFIHRAVRTLCAFLSDIKRYLFLSIGFGSSNGSSTKLCG